MQGRGTCASRLTGVKDRLASMERRAEALWHVKEGEQEVRGVVDRLKLDMESMQSLHADTQVGGSDQCMMLCDDRLLGG